jgi:nitrogen regulatory protein PII
MTSRLSQRKLLTIICEAGIESDITDHMTSLGAPGYTITDARGKGAHGLRDGLWPENANIRIEILCDDTLATSLLDLLVENYYKNYTMVAYITDIGVLRPNKFVKPKQPNHTIK